MQDSTATAAATGGGDLAKTLLLAALAVLAAWYIYTLFRANAEAKKAANTTPTPTGLGIGFVTNFFDTLGIGSFAPTTAIFRSLRMVPDEKIPGTLNVGHTLPTIAQTFIYTRIVPVESTTLILMILAAMAGSYFGAGVVSNWSRRKIQIGMGAALLFFAFILFGQLRNLIPPGGEAVGVSGVKLGMALAGNFALGALMTLGIGLYAPCMVLVSMLGMNVQAAFPIMMGSCAFLMPVASRKFIVSRSFDMKTAIGLAIGGIPAVLIAAFIVKSLPLTPLKWVVLGVILITAATLLRAGLKADATADGRETRTA